MLTSNRTGFEIKKRRTMKYEGAQMGKKLKTPKKEKTSSK